MGGSPGWAWLILPATRTSHQKLMMMSSLFSEGSASCSGLSRHGMAEPGCLDVDLPPDTDIVLNAWDDVTDEVDEVVGPQDLRWAGDHKVPSPAEALL